MFCLPSSRIWFICAEFWLDKKQFPYWRIANCLGKNEPLPLSRTLDCVLNNFWNRKWSNSRKNQQFWTDPGTKSSKQSFKNIPTLIINVSFSFYIIYNIWYIYFSRSCKWYFESLDRSRKSNSLWSVFRLKVPRPVNYFIDFLSIYWY